MGEICACLELEKTREIVKKYEGKQGVLVHILQDVQLEFGYLPENAMNVIAKELDISLAHAYGVASFYTRFYFTPRGENIIRVCMGTACHVRGSHAILEEFETNLGLKDGETSDDLKFTLETVSCVGCCALAPVVVINDVVSKERNPKRIVAKLRGEEEQGD
ncbi:MAG: NAD(P)H-dependent oxidoreductase subunit E [Actinomycetota bacterium]|nr:NAD(P)H-dependent oxidoreductase subunit E [Actinomycetota bacterium]MDI6822266.1 NAD(P)H-dependent oxidoreductase subunit E [Actinomycetota bacterium]